jgi:hypothetical protein
MISEKLQWTRQPSGVRVDDVPPPRQPSGVRAEIVRESPLRMIKYKGRWVLLTAFAESLKEAERRSRHR